jgi:hypothetical protein
MMMIFDYAFYSLYNLYLEKERKEYNNINSASYAIFGLKASLLLGIGILTSALYEGRLSENLGISKTSFTVLVVLFLFLFSVFDKSIYKKRLPKIIKKYKNYPRNKWFRPWMLYFVALGFVLIPILIIKALKAFS